MLELLSFLFLHHSLLLLFFDNNIIFHSISYLKELQYFTIHRCKKSEINHFYHAKTIYSSAHYYCDICFLSFLNFFPCTTVKMRILAFLIEKRKKLQSRWRFSFWNECYGFFWEIFIVVFMMRLLKVLYENLNIVL